MAALALIHWRNAAHFSPNHVGTLQLAQLLARLRKCKLIVHEEWLSAGKCELIFTMSGSLANELD